MPVSSPVFFLSSPLPPLLLLQNFTLLYSTPLQSSLHYTMPLQCVFYPTLPSSLLQSSILLHPILPSHYSTLPYPTLLYPAYYSTLPYPLLLLHPILPYPPHCSLLPPALPQPTSLYLALPQLALPPPTLLCTFYSIFLTPISTVPCLTHFSTLLSRFVC